MHDDPNHLHGEFRWRLPGMPNAAESHPPLREAPMRIMAGGAWSACAAVGGKLANPKGSCVRWPKKAWPARVSKLSRPDIRTHSQQSSTNRRSSMTKVKSVLATAVTAAVLATGMSAAFADSKPSTAYMGGASMAKADIVGTAIGAGQFNTLAKALTAADLVDTLKDRGRSPSSRRPTRRSPRSRREAQRASGGQGGAGKGADLSRRVRQGGCRRRADRTGEDG